jgi:hypothetical protein
VGRVTDDNDDLLGASVQLKGLPEPTAVYRVVWRDNG